jgi:hypothetical protein
MSESISIRTTKKEKQVTCPWVLPLIELEQNYTSASFHDNNVSIGATEGRSAFSPLKKRETAPVTTPPPPTSAPTPNNGTLSTRSPPSEGKKKILYIFISDFVISD